MKKTTDYTVDGLAVLLPLRCENYRYQYPGQFHHQSAYIELDPVAKTLTCDWNGEIGNAVPFSVYHGRVLRFTFPPFSKLRDVRDTMKWSSPTMKSGTAIIGGASGMKNCMIRCSAAFGRWEDIDMARPELPAAQKRDTYIMIRLTKEENALVRQAAKAHFRSPADLVRALLLEHVFSKMKKATD